MNKEMRDILWQKYLTLVTNPYPLSSREWVLSSLISKTFGRLDTLLEWDEKDQRPSSDFLISTIKDFFEDLKKEFVKLEAEAEAEIVRHDELSR